PRDVVTPLAREVAAELGVEIVVTSPKRPPDPDRAWGRTAGTVGPSRTTSSAHAGTARTPSPVGRQPAGPPQARQDRPAPGAVRAAAPAAPPRPSERVEVPPVLWPPSPALYRRGAPARAPSMPVGN